MPLRLQGAASVSAPQPRRLLEFRVRLHSQRFDRNDLFRSGVLEVFELFASAKVRFRSHLCIIGRLGQQRDVVLLDEAKPHAVAVQPTLLAQGDSARAAHLKSTLIAERSMEPLWSPAVATRGKRWQMRRRRKPRKQAKSVAAGCHQLPANFHGKGRVDATSPLVKEGVAFLAPQERGRVPRTLRLAGGVLDANTYAAAVLPMRLRRPNLDSGSTALLRPIFNADSDEQARELVGGELDRLPPRRLCPALTEFEGFLKKSACPFVEGRYLDQTVLLQ
jgi:hypothetical protein